MEKKQMSKSIGSLFGTGSVKYDNSPTTNLVKYLDEYDTSNVDNTLKNLTNWANTSSANNLTDMNYTFDVNASDKARQQAQDATYQAYIDRLNPQFAQQQSDLSTSLQNKGLAVGSEAYQRAMNDMQDNQNEALNQAAYQSVLAGQNAYSQDLANQISAGQFANQANSQYIADLLNALTGSASGYEKAMDKYSAQSNASANSYAAKQQAYNNRNAMWNAALGAAGSAAGKS
jgi:flagellar biosynthesis chaperone FliJ